MWTSNTFNFFVRPKQGISWDIMEDSDDLPHKLFSFIGIAFCCNQGIFRICKRSLLISHETRQWCLEYHAFEGDWSRSNHFTLMSILSPRVPAQWTKATKAGLSMLRFSIFISRKLIPSAQFWRLKNSLSALRQIYFSIFLRGRRVLKAKSSQLRSLTFNLTMAILNGPFDFI